LFRTDSLSTFPDGGGVLGDWQPVRTQATANATGGKKRIVFAIIDMKTAISSSQ
jgi:hypothetical protein